MQYQWSFSIRVRSCHSVVQQISNWKNNAMDEAGSAAIRFQEVIFNTNKQASTRSNTCRSITKEMRSLVFSKSQLNLDLQGSYLDIISNINNEILWKMSRNAKLQSLVVHPS